MDFRPLKFETRGGAGVLHTAHSSNQVERIGIEASILQDAFFEMHAHDFAEDQAPARRLASEIDDPVQFAFKADWRFRDLGRFHDLGWPGGESCQLKLIHRALIIPTGEVHGFSHGEGHDIHHEFAGFANVAQRVLGGGPAVDQPQRRRKAEKRGLGRYHVEEGERGEVQASITQCGNHAMGRGATVLISMR